jgi:hypothetical protein
MYRYLSDATNLKAVFGSYTTLEALQVKHHIERVVKQLKIPSRALLEHMQQEGICLSELETERKSEAEPGMMSEAVLRRHLRDMFLDQAKLLAALSALSLSQQVEVRDLLQVIVSYLRLPSDTLLRRMQDEGLTLDKLGVKTQPDLTEVRDKLRALNQQYATKQPAEAAASLAQLKQRIEQLDTHKAELQGASEIQAPNVVEIARLQDKLKAQG